MVAGLVFNRVRDELTRWVVTVNRSECCRMASQKGQAWSVFTTVPTSRALDPDEIAACIGHKEELLRWGSDPEINKVLPEARRRAGDDRRL
uniref:Uncharacterized protein n=1 Tax=Nelumbo nucifera TaxID=4432 RepID=A0A822YWW9_NELNU|nr:TPA_asm: hypothetical protein HUJ06_005885 [Nelumbo nucifera]